MKSIYKKYVFLIYIHIYHIIYVIYYIYIYIIFPFIWKSLAAPSCNYYQYN